MSWFRQIKTIYSTTYVLLLYILWTLVSTMFLSNQVSFNIYLIALLTVFLMEIFYCKEYKKYTTIVVPLLIGGIALILNYKLYLALLNFAFLVMATIIIYLDEGRQINYSEYKTKWINGAYVIFALTLFSIIVSPNVLKPIFRVYVMYFILVIINLRESLRYSYKIRSKYSKYINIGIVLLVVVMFQEATYRIFTVVVNKLFYLINSGLDFIVSLIIAVVKYPISYGIEYLKEILLSLGINIDNIFPVSDNAVKQLAKTKVYFQNDNFHDSYSTWIVVSMLKVLIGIAILIIVIRTISALTKVESKESGYIEYKEKIEKHKKSQHNLFSKLAKNIFRRKGTVREEVLYNYAEFEKTVDKVDIFKPYMTASQLKNVTKIKVENVDYLDNMTNIYNEAKFSNHKIEEEKLGIVKKAVNNIKAQLK